MKLNTFNGGLQTRKSPRHLQPNEAVECVNVDIESQELKSCNDVGPVIEPAVAPYYFEAKDLWFDQADEREYLPYKDTLYWTDGQAPSKYKDGIVSNLGVAAPASASFVGSLTRDWELQLETKFTTDFDIIEPPGFTYGTKTPILEVKHAKYALTGAPYTGQVITTPNTFYALLFVLYVENVAFASVTVVIDNGSVPGASEALDLNPWVSLVDAPPGTELKVGMYFTGSGYLELENLVYLGGTPTSAVLTHVDYTKASGLLPPHSDWVDNTIPLVNKFVVTTEGITYNVTNNTVTGLNFAKPAVFGIFGAGGAWIDLNFSSYQNSPFGIAEADLRANLQYESFDYSRELDIKEVTASSHYAAFLRNTLPVVATTSWTYTTPVRYLYTYYNTATGVESAPSSISASITGTTYSTALVYVQKLGQADPNVIVRLYRIGDSLSFTLVKELPNENRLIVDTSTNLPVIGGILPDDIGGFPPSDLRYLTASSGLFFGSVGEALRFTDVLGNIEVWKETHYLDFEELITGISDSPSGLVVFTKYKTYLITGNSPATLNRQLLSGDQGCIEHRTIVKSGGVLLFWSTDGVCTLIGGKVEVISKFAVGKLLEVPKVSVVIDEVYYTQLADKVLAFDLRYAPVFIMYAFSSTWLATAEDKLYVVKAGNRHEAFAGPLLNYNYKTGLFTEGSDTEVKLYNEIYVSCEGIHVLEVLINNKVVQTVTITGSDVPSRIRIPVNKQRGTNISFNLTGTGIVKEIEYKTEGRKK